MGSDSRNRLFTKSPAELVESNLDREQAHREGRRKPIGTGISEVDRRIRTMFAGQLVYLVGLPSNGKTLLLKVMARLLAEEIMGDRRENPEGGAKDEFVLFTSLEEPEDIVYAEIAGAPASVTQIIDGAYDSDEYRAHLIRSPKHWPLWIQGYDERDVHDLDGEIPNFTVEQAYREVVQLWKDHGIRPRAWYVDYLQLWASDLRTGEESRERLNIANTSRQLKRYAKTLGIPVVAAAQAKQTVGDRRIPIPTSQDIEGSNQARKDADVIITVCLPHMSPTGTWEKGITIGGRMYTDDQFGDTAMILTLEKQRMGAGWGRWVVRTDLASKHIYGEAHRAHG